MIKKLIKKNWEALVVLLMIFYDSTLHWADILGVWEYHPLYPKFTMGSITYDIFWTAFWTIAFILIAKLIIKLNTKSK